VTERLYDQDAYLTEFDATIVARETWAGRAAVELDRTAFYPEGGGQPADQGTLDGHAVVDVQLVEGRILHLLANGQRADDLPGRVHGVIAWPRRWDHMQQHSGQHILSQAFIAAVGAETVAFHLGTDAATIDLDRVGLDEGVLRQVEEIANDVVMANRPVSARFVTLAELAALPLRRPPTVTERIRIVEVAGFDWSACGGTHVRATGEVGPIKIIKTERRGAETRVTFLCGRRALADYGRKHALLQRVVNRFTCAEDELEAAVERLDEEARRARKELRAVEEELVRYQAAALWAEAPLQGDVRVVARIFAEHTPERMRALARALCERPRTVVLLGWGGASPQWVFARSQDLAVDMGAILRVALQATGGRGGGRGEWAQGGGGDPSRSEEVLVQAMAALTPSIRAA
jgi:alanyl-tRNA synthetase